MVATSDKHFECPNCGWVLTFRLANNKYISTCLMCENRLEMTKEEYEDERETIEFTPDF